MGCCATDSQSPRSHSIVYEPLCADIINAVAFVVARPQPPATRLCLFYAVHPQLAITTTDTLYTDSHATDLPFRRCGLVEQATQTHRMRHLLGAVSWCRADVVRGCPNVMHTRRTRILVGVYTYTYTYSIPLCSFYEHHNALPSLAAFTWPTSWMCVCVCVCAQTVYQKAFLRRDSVAWMPQNIALCCLFSAVENATAEGKAVERIVGGGGYTMNAAQQACVCTQFV